MKLLKYLSIIGLCLLAIGCVGEEVRVNSTEVGYKITAEGLSNKEWSPGVYRLDWCSGVGDACDRFLRVDVGKHTTTISVTRVFLPKSNVDLENVEAAVQMQVKPTVEARQQVIKDVKAVVPDDSVAPNGIEKLITQEAIAEVYINRIIPEMIIQTLKQYTVEQTLSDVVEIGKSVQQAVNGSLTTSPVMVTELSFSNGIGQVPNEVITAKRKLYAVDEEKERTIKAISAELVVEEKRQAFQVVRVSNNKKNADKAGIPYGQYVELMTGERVADALETLAANSEMFASNGVPFGFGMPANALKGVSDAK